jgi:carboxyl-terminal processing protease
MRRPTDSSLGARLWITAIILTLLFGFAVRVPASAQSRTAETVAIPQTSPVAPHPDKALIPLPVTARPLFVAAYRSIIDHWLLAPPMPKMLTQGLARIIAVDPALSVTHDQRYARIMRDGQEQMRFALPTDLNPDAWADVTIAALNMLLALAPAVNQGEQRMYQLVLEGVVSQLDPFSRYTEPDRARSDRSFREGYDGLGLQTRLEGGQHIIAEVAAQSPAAQVGITPGDRLLAVDGVDVTGLSASLVARLLQGDEGSMASIAIQPRHGEQRRLSLRRQHIMPNTIRLAVADGVAVVRIERFNNATQDNVRLALIKAHAPKFPLNGIILDLRGNPGGVLVQAVGVANLFLAEGRIITTQGRHPSSMQWFEAQRPMATFADLPVIVLIDGQTASSAEAVAAALQDRQRALVIGTSSYGKGSVQHVTQLPNGGELLITWSRIYTPSGYSFDHQGVQPHLCASREWTTLDSLLAEAIRPDTTLEAALARDRMAASDHGDALQRLRSRCPQRTLVVSDPEQDDASLLAARRILADPALYARALALRHANIAQR